MGYLSELLGGKEIVPVGPLLVDDSDAMATGTRNPMNFYFIRARIWPYGSISLPWIY